MATYTEKTAPRVWKKREKNVNKNADISSRAAAIEMRKTAKRLAPRRTGETVRGIRFKKKKDKRYEVTSKVIPKGRSRFMQNFWANQSEPWLAARMFWNENQPTIYSDGSHRTTGTPGFFNAATAITRQKFIKISRRNNLRALRSVTG